MPAVPPAQSGPIEAQWVVSIRFLVALPRHGDLEWGMDVLRRGRLVYGACVGAPVGINCVTA